MLIPKVSDRLTAKVIWNHIVPRFQEKIDQYTTPDPGYEAAGFEDPGQWFIKQPVLDGKR